MRVRLGIASVVSAVVAVLAVATPAHSATADRLAYLDQSQLFVFDADGRSRELGPKYPSDLAGGAWSPDGSRIAYLSSVDAFETWPVYRNQIRTIRADGSGDREVFTFSHCCGTPAIVVEGQTVSAPAWSPDGSRLAFVLTSIVCPAWGVCTSQSALMTVRSDGSRLTTLAADATSWDELAWSPDGTQIAYTSADATTRIGVVSTDGIGVPTFVSPIDLQAWAPAWSKDGRIAFLATSPAEVVFPREGAIWVTLADGSDARKLRASSSQAPAWSPDGRQIAYGAARGIAIVRPADGGIEQLTAPTAGYTDHWPRWSPSGRSVAFVRMSNEWGTPAWLVSADVARVAKPRRLARFDEYRPTYAWAPR